MHNQRFFSYLTLFSFFMILLVTADNYLLMFLAWEGIGVVSYLLINFWFTRIAATKAAVLALTQNRVGDTLLTLGLFGMLWAVGNLDYSTVFSIIPYMNETVTTIIALLLLGGASAKSAQLFLNTWLPHSMEGLLKITNISFNSKYSQRTLVTDSRSNNTIISSIPKETLEIITGNLLGDGSLQRPKPYTKSGLESKAQASYAMTLSVKGYNYMLDLYDQVYAPFCSNGIFAYPNISLPQHKDKIVTQYSFSTMRLPLFTSLHTLWYKWDSDAQCYVKIVPVAIADWFTARSLAHWIMEDGYFYSYGRTQTILLCTESFSKTECEFLQELLLKLNINSTLKIRNKITDRYGIRISKKSMPLLRELVSPYMHKDFLYKLNGQ